MQFSLKWLLIAIAFVAVSLVALLNANDLWRIGLRTAVLFSVLIAIIGAVASAAATRLFCVGYAIVALPFLTNFLGADWGSDLITHSALSEVHGKLFSPKEETVAQQDVMGFPGNNFDGDLVGVRNFDGNNNTAIASVIRPKKRHFAEVGHAVLSALLGVVGGIVAVAFYRRRTRPAASSV
jgi:hypothetical protein